jgi:flagellar hook-associated protein 1
MTSLLSVLAIAGEGMAAQTVGLSVSGQNIANVDTPGYSMLSPVLETSAEGGVQVSGIASAYSNFAAGALVNETGQQGAAQARSNALAQTQALLSPGAGETIGDSADAFFTAMTGFSSDPTSASARATALSAAGDLAQAVSSTAAGLSTQRSQLLTQAQGVAGTLNQTLAQIATLNGQIVSGNAQGTDTSALQSQRNSLVLQAGASIGITSLPSPSGAVTLVSSGSVLVDGTNASSLSVGLGAGGSMRIQLQQPGGSTVDVTPQVTSGTLGGILEARDTDIPAVQGQLDQYAYDLSNQVNALQTAGYGADGVTGRPLFTPPAAVAGAAAAMAIDPAVAGNPAALAGSSTAAGVPGGNDVATAIAQLSSEPIGAEGTPSEAFGSISSNLGTAVASANADLTLRTDTVAQATQLDDSQSGVSTDEEMVKMTQYQQAYQASVQVMQTVSLLFTSLMTAVEAT